MKLNREVIIFIVVSLLLFSCVRNDSNNQKNNQTNPDSEKNLLNDYYLNKEKYQDTLEENTIGNSEHSEKSESEPVENTLSFRLSKGYFHADSEWVYYHLEGTITNITDKVITSMSLSNFEDDKDRYYDPRISVQFDYGNPIYRIEPQYDSCRFFTDKNFCPVFSSGERKNNPYPWKPGEVKTVAIIFGRTTINFEPSIHTIQFNYTPLYCVLTIPYTVEDPVGWRKAGFLGPYNIMSDWKKYQDQLQPQ